MEEKRKDVAPEQKTSVTHTVEAAKKVRKLVKEMYIEGIMAALEGRPVVWLMPLDSVLETSGQSQPPDGDDGFHDLRGAPEDGCVGRCATPNLDSAVERCPFGTLLQLPVEP